MNAQQFLDKNKLISCKQLAELLGVSSGTVTKMKTDVTRIQSLALDALHYEQCENNIIDLELTEWFHKSAGNTYFSGWVCYLGQWYFIPFQYGYGSHAEDVAVKLLESKGLIPTGKRRFELATEYNIKVRVDNIEVSRKGHMFDGSEH